MKLLHPQELEVFYFIPAIRKELSVQMKKKGKGQREIANLLGITEAAVSQYISSKRAT
ncbi:MAG TPA: transcriptional regulator, partial [Nanoarchaeota archaeon]|nr:transcriptional regulator [Nanoarchaeota archaeon]